MDGLFHGKPNFLMDDLGCFPPISCGGGAQPAAASIPPRLLETPKSPCGLGNLFGVKLNITISGGKQISVFKSSLQEITHPKKSA